MCLHTLGTWRKAHADLSRRLPVDRVRALALQTEALVGDAGEPAAARKPVHADG